MKRIYLSLSLMLTMALTTALASDGIIVSKEVQASFKKEFPLAEILAWNESGDYARATFILDGHRTEAYFSEDGQFLGSIRFIFFSQLPLAATRAVDKRYANADVVEACEITNAEGTIYRLILETQGRKYRVKVDANGNITQSEKLKK